MCITQNKYYERTRKKTEPFMLIFVSYIMLFQFSSIRIRIGISIRIILVVIIGEFSNSNVCALTACKFKCQSNWELCG